MKTKLPPHIVSPTLLWFGFLAGLIVWPLLLFVDYAFEAMACNAGVSSGVITIWLHVITLIAVLIMIAAIAVSWRSWQTMGKGDGTESGPDVAGGRASFMALSGVILGILFLFFILVSDIAPFYLSACGGGV